MLPLNPHSATGNILIAAACTDSRHGSHARRCFFESFADSSTGSVAALRQTHAHRDEAAAIESGIDVEPGPKTLQGGHGRGEQYHRTGQLEDHQHLAGEDTAPIGGNAAAGRKSRDLRAVVHNRSQPHGDCARDGDRDDGEDQFPIGTTSAARGSPRRANFQLAPARREPRQQEARQIGAGHEAQTQSGDLQNQQPIAKALLQAPVLEGDHLCGVSGILVRILAGQALHHSLQIGLRRPLWRNPGFAAAGVLLRLVHRRDVQRAAADASLDFTKSVTAAVT